VVGRLGYQRYEQRSPRRPSSVGLRSTVMLLKIAAVVVGVVSSESPAFSPGNGNPEHRLQLRAFRCHSPLLNPFASFDHSTLRGNAATHISPFAPHQLSPVLSPSRHRHLSSLVHSSPSIFHVALASDPPNSPDSPLVPHSTGRFSRRPSPAIYHFVIRRTSAPNCLVRKKTFSGSAGCWVGASNTTSTHLSQSSA